MLYHPTTGVFTKTNGSYVRQDFRNGYARVRVPGYGHLKVHRLAFLFMEGTWPENQVDHIDGNKANNVWANLRLATNAQNHQNRLRANKNNSTGLLGVRKYNNSGKFFAEITIERTTINLGIFDTAEEAHEAYIKVKRELHPFGEL